MCCKPLPEREVGKAPSNWPLSAASSVHTHTPNIIMVPDRLPQQRRRQQAPTCMYADYFSDPSLYVRTYGTRREENRNRRHHARLRGAQRTSANKSVAAPSISGGWDPPIARARTAGRGARPIGRDVFGQSESDQEHAEGTQPRFPLINSLNSEVKYKREREG